MILIGDLDATGRGIGELPGPPRVGCAPEGHSRVLAVLDRYVAVEVGDSAMNVRSEAAQASPHTVPTSTGAVPPRPVRAAGAADQVTGPTA